MTALSWRWGNRSSSPHDRPALVKQIKERLGNRVSLVETEGNGIALVLAIVGCSTACADLSPFAGLEIRVITRPEDAESVIRDLETITS